ncbi:MAG: hypothetical protein U0797_00410 [Gemmataceae bacterium]
MRKLFWGGLAGGVAIAAGVLSTAHFAVRYPDSAVGQFLYGASHTVAVMNPFSGFAPALARLEQDGRSIPGGEEPAEPLEPAQSAPPAEFAAAAPIVIPEDDPVPAAPIPVLPDTLCPAHYPEASQLVAPVAMPRCEESFERSGIDFNDPERLHMPQQLGDAEEQEAADCPAGCADKLLRALERMIRRAPGAPACPGKSPCRPREGKPHGLFQTSVEELCPAREKVDTMEYRATDRQLYDYGFGPL